MTDRLYQRDSYLRTFEARVTAADGDRVVLDRTAFFPTGGGVPGDLALTRTENKGKANRRVYFVLEET